MESVPVIILCGGQGTRMRGATLTKKELVKIGGRPVIWHVMRIFSAHGFDQFILTLGYEAEQIKKYFLDYEEMSRDVSLNVGNQPDSSQLIYLSQLEHRPWQISLIDTGLQTEKASRIGRVAKFIQGDRFFVSYGDDVSDVDLTELMSFHKEHGKLATLTAVQINLPYGIVEADERGLVSGFVERPRLPYWINGGFMLFENKVLEMMIGDDNINLETEVLPELARREQLMIFRHPGFWQSMNTMKDNLMLEDLWQQGPPWKIW